MMVSQQRTGGAFTTIVAETPLPSSASTGGGAKGNIRETIKGATGHNGMAVQILQVLKPGRADGVSLVKIEALKSAQALSYRLRPSKGEAATSMSRRRFEKGRLVGLRWRLIKWGRNEQWSGRPARRV